MRRVVAVFITKAFYWYRHVYALDQGFPTDGFCASDPRSGGRALTVAICDEHFVMGYGVSLSVVAFICPLRLGALIKWSG